jgi:hypothetical protein
MYDSVYSELANNQISRLGISNYAISVPDLNRSVIQSEIEELTNGCQECRNGKYYGKEISLSVNFFEQAQQISVDNGSIWLLEIASNDSEGFQFLFDDFYLPKGCQLFFYNEEKDMYLGAFTYKNNRDDNEFITQHINGNVIYIELFVPNGLDEQPRLSLSNVVYIFDNCFRKGPFSSEGAASCNVNAACESGGEWAKEIRSVAIILLKQSGSNYYGICSGTLINKYSGYQPDDKPYFLTANHCYEDMVGNQSIYSNINNWVFLFGHDASSCLSNGSDISNSRTKSVAGATIVSRDAKSRNTDYLLLQLKGSVYDISKYNVSYAGWGTNEMDERTLNTVTIHHPKGDVKKISKSRIAPVSGQFVSEKFTCAADNHWRIFWDTGITEGGSSGSPLFNSYHDLIGILTGGSSSCQNNGPDFYGKFSKAVLDGGLVNYLGPHAPSSQPVFDNELPVYVNVLPEKIYTGENAWINLDIAGAPPYQWWVWINKNWNETWAYKYGDPKCYNFSGTNSTGHIQVGPVNFPNPGIHRCTIYVMDANGMQSTIITGLTAIPKFGLRIHLKQENTPLHQVIFPKGATLQISQNALYERDGSNWGIKRVVWSSGKTETFNILEYEPGPMAGNLPYPAYYYLPSSHCFSLNNEGIYKIGATIYRGSYDENEDGTYSYPLKEQKYTSGSKEEMTVEVIDCEEEVTITDQHYPPIGGHLIVDNVTFTSVRDHELSAYKSIKLTPGTHIQNGARFSTKMLKCPDFPRRCQPTRFSVDHEQVIISEPEGKISVFPNPTKDLIKIDISDVFLDILYYEIFSPSGLLLVKKSPFSNIEEFHLKDQPNGLYVVRIIYKNGKHETRKVILNK